jgi:hypothetical protein
MGLKPICASTSAGERCRRGRSPPPGITNAVGMALAEKMLAAEFNRPGHEIVDHSPTCSSATAA